MKVGISNKSKLNWIIQKKFGFRVLFFGNDNVSLECFNVLHNKSKTSPELITKLDVLTTPLESNSSTQANFHNSLKSLEIKRFYFNSKKKDMKWLDIYPELDKENYNIGIVASFGSMIPSKLIDKFSKGCFVMHPSLLPKYRGACPIQYSLLNGDLKTGVSLIEASKKSFDKGCIIKQTEVEISVGDRFEELSKKLSRIGGEDTVEFLSNYEAMMKEKKHQFIDPIDTSQYAPLFKDKKMAYLDFRNTEKEKVLLTYKAFYGSQIQPFTKLRVHQEERLLFFENLSLPGPEHLDIVKHAEEISTPGGIYWDMSKNKDLVFIKASNGWLCSSSLKINRRNTMGAKEFVTSIFREQRFAKGKKSLAYFTLNY